MTQLESYINLLQGRFWVDGPDIGEVPEAIVKLGLYTIELEKQIAKLQDELLAGEGPTYRALEDRVRKLEAER